jgi:hypothetical protein
MKLFNWQIEIIDELRKSTRKMKIKKIFKL